MNSMTKIMFPKTLFIFDKTVLNQTWNFVKIQ